jgi:hypothetical protein
MLFQVRGFRKKSSSHLWRVVVFFWVISVTNTLLFPAFTIPLKERSESIAIHSDMGAKTSPLKQLLLLIFTSVDAHADLADTSEETADKIEFVSSRHYLIREAQQYNEPTPFTHLNETFANAVLEKFTPPPKVG